jgi:signal transduction histidine kinase
MKTELITNVSHDIKTPLTSIINYADLIAREKPENEKIAEYCEVLTRQSGKLKRLIEDLVEASKASTGNLEVNPVPCDASIFLQQAGGEYEEKLEAAGLSLVTKLPDREIMILADSRRMWRVFDNLMNNVCKYSQQGTRVYLSLEAEGQEAVITFKNTSARQLDISPEELMERFVRGDSSRNTEGNGLGLSIARSLTELQGGSFSLQVDGDLFKAILRFPIFFMNS